MTTQKIGTTIPTNGKKVETPVATVVAITTPKKEEAAKPAEPLTPLDERLHKLSQLFELQGRHTRLIKSQEKLKEFQLTKGEENISLTLSDDNNSKLPDFKTSNPDIIREVMACLASTINEKRKVVESLLVV